LVWTAIVPFKPAGTRKTRLAARLSVPQRDQLSETLLWRTLTALTACPQVDNIVLLSTKVLPGWQHGLFADEGGGLNAELSRAQQKLGAENLVVVHADLPFVAATDITELIGHAATGCAIAPDRHGTGTNALALQGFPDFSFSFGDSSLETHRVKANGRERIVVRPGLALDIDTPDDLDLAAMGSLDDFFKIYPKQNSCH
jgi:2-phospho-L-lactate guanylyltransferase